MLLPNEKYIVIETDRCFPTGIKILETQFYTSKVGNITKGTRVAFEGPLTEHQECHYNLSVWIFLILNLGKFYFKTKK